MFLLGNPGIGIILCIAQKSLDIEIQVAKIELLQRTMRLNQIKVDPICALPNLHCC